MPEPDYILRDRLEWFQRIVDGARARLNALSHRDPRRPGLETKIFDATRIVKLIRWQLGEGPAPTGARVGHVGGVKVRVPVWETTS